MNLYSHSSFSHPAADFQPCDIAKNERNIVLHGIDYDEWLLINTGTTLPKSHFPWPLANKVIRVLKERYHCGHPFISSNTLEALLDTQREYYRMTPVQEILGWDVHDLFERYVCDLGVYSYLQFESAEAVELEKVNIAHEELMSIMTDTYRTLRRIEQVPCISAQRLRQELIQSYLFSGLPCAH